ncbi:peptidylprolyl isomerase [Amaricoccus macauensis]|uniref:Peptidyl-prolyl cis-trans isomerase n=1 Tax=Amaricoccus macauensis TaxID=57001 RepID=A0A840SSB7_9RHOB|nr:peptidylprolyl isomerase [Amaricoccus macauensis]MBB5222233.1 peptidylprolyl isomerase [Amaricoccus macauensis]
MRRLALGLAVVALGATAAAADTLQIDVDGSVKGTVEIELLPEVAPQHVAQIEALAKAGAYDGVVFHRVIEGFMAQTGDVQFGKKGSPNIAQAGMGGSDMPDLKAEFSDLKFERGTVGMARAMDPDSANSQFFIMFEPAPSLDGQYTVVGKVISGQDVVDQIRRGDGPNGEVSDPDWMAKVTVKAD